MGWRQHKSQHGSRPEGKCREEQKKNGAGAKLNLWDAMISAVEFNLCLVKKERASS